MEELLEECYGYISDYLDLAKDTNCDDIDLEEIVIFLDKIQNELES